MNGTERAALRLVLGLVRRSVLGRGDGWVSLHDAWALGIRAELPRGPLGQALNAGRFAGPREARVVRVRLALYLRAVLRAERDDRGRWWRATHWRETVPVEQGGWPDPNPDPEAHFAEPPVSDAWVRVRLVRPLWLDAPPAKSRSASGSGR
jgi:hypothetical protein